MANQTKPDQRRGEMAFIFAIIMGLVLGIIIKKVRIGILIGLIIGIIILFTGWLRTKKNK
jgi:divalent metal cation (Fe/Co/Zn/Cd) transporter